MRKGEAEGKRGGIRERCCEENDARARGDDVAAGGG